MAWPRLQRTLSVVVECSQFSSLHGMRHIVKKGASLKERLFWFLLLLHLGSHMSYLCLSRWAEYRRTPTATVLRDSTMSICGQPFPCIGFCPSHQIDKTVGMRILKEIAKDVNRTYFESYAHGPFQDEGQNSSEGLLDNMWTRALHDDQLEVLLLALHRLTNPGVGATLPLLNRHWFQFMALDTVNVVDFMKRVFPTCDTFFYSCLWKGIPFDCCKHFYVKPTEMGYCYFFKSEQADNMVCAEAFPESGRQERKCRDQQKLSFYGHGSGLRIFLNNLRDPASIVDDRLDHTLGKLVISDVCMATLLNTEYDLESHPAGVYSFSVSSQHTIMERSLLAMSPKLRGCYSSDEWPGTTAENRKNFPVKYNLYECILLCQRQFVLNTCNCLIYPLTLGDSNTICLLSRFDNCIKEISGWVRFFRPPPHTPGFTPEEFTKGMNCSHCLNSCDSAIYLADVRYPNGGYREWKNFSGFSERTMVDVFYGGPNQGVLYAVVPTLTVGHLLVTFGAVANLFLGVSLLTVMEVIVVAAKSVWALCVKSEREIPLK